MIVDVNAENGIINCYEGDRSLQFKKKGWS